MPPPKPPPMPVALLLTVLLLNVSVPELNMPPPRLSPPLGPLLALPLAWAAFVLDPPCPELSEKVQLLIVASRTL